MTPTPSKCFEVVNCDFKGPFHDGYYVHVFLDQFSKWPEIYFTKSKSLEAVKNVFHHFLLLMENQGARRQIMVVLILVGHSNPFWRTMESDTFLVSLNRLGPMKLRM